LTQIAESHRAGLLRDTVAEAERVEAGAGEKSLGKAHVLRPERAHHVEVALKPSGREDDEIRPEGLPLGVSEMHALDAAHPALLHDQRVDLEVPEEADVGVPDCVAIDGAHETEPPTHRLMEPGDAVAWNPEGARELDSHGSEPVVDLLARVCRIVANPRLVRVLAPLEEIPRRDLGSIDDPLSFLYRSADDGKTSVGQDRVAAEDRPQVHDEHCGSASRRFERRGEPRDPRSHDDDVGLPGLFCPGFNRDEDQDETEKTP
jgi:hypothetical protein